MDKNLIKIIDHYISDFENKKSLPYVVKNSVPIIWFGNIEKYFLSSKKVITVANNPSLIEFSEVRFPEALLHFNRDNLYKSLNGYFDYNPYKKWFNRYEKILNWINVTYGGKMDNYNMPNTALSLDLFTPIATDPKWGELTNFEKMKISNFALFNEIYSYLNPDIVFVSIAKEAAAEFFKFSTMDKVFSGNSGFLEVYTDGKRKYIFGHNRSMVFSGSGMSDAFIRQTLSELKI